MVFVEGSYLVVIKS